MAKAYTLFFVFGIFATGSYSEYYVTPSFTSTWLLIKAVPTSESRVEIYHGFGKLPARVIAEIKTGDQEMITYATGSAQTDDDHKVRRYGGVVCVYNENYVKLFAPYHDHSLAGVFFSGGIGWTGPEMIHEFQAFVRVKVWSSLDLPEPSFVMNWKPVDTGNNRTTFFEVDHGLGSVPDLIVVQVRGDQDRYISEATGSTSVLYQHLPRNLIGGVIFGYSETSVRVWAPHGGDGVFLFFANDGWGKVNIREKTGYISIKAYMFSEKPLINRTMIERYEFSEPLTLPKHKLPEGIEVEVILQIIPKSGPNAGYIFHGVGTSMNEGIFDVCSGLIYARIKNVLFLWKPKNRDSLFRIGGIWGTPETTQSTGDVTIRIIVWDILPLEDVHCPVDFIEEFERTRNCSISFESNSYNGVMSISCQPGYRYENGTTTRHCERTGEWSEAEDIQCIEIICPPPDDIANGNVSTTGNVLGSIAYYDCYEGYRVPTSMNTYRHCQVNSTWSEIEPTCEKVTCPSPPSVANGSVKATGNVIGSEAHYSCNDGYAKASTVTKHICQSDSTWSGVLPTCKPIFCSNDSISVAFTTMNMTGYGYLDNITYQCFEGFPLIAGSLIHTCNASGLWEGEPPSCKGCACPCKSAEEDMNTLTEFELKKLMRQLKINPRTTSLAIRRRVSVYEDRLAAKGMGIFSILLLIAEMLFIIFLDIATITAHIKTAVSNIKSRYSA